MKRITAFVILASALLALTGPALAAPEHLNTIERECATQLRLPAAACVCMRDRAGRLKDGQQAFVAAVVVKDRAAQARIRGNLTIDELTEAGMFMTSAPAQCARR
ncbi:MAG TPA: hypothetical protein VI565_03150 [Burkholderiales bacterium]|nr:hypothetical protein [Burkholderiales bacterium]